MSAYPPPREQLPLYDASVFIDTQGIDGQGVLLTQGEADTRYLKLVAQSDEDMNNKALLKIQKLVFSDLTEQNTAASGGVPVGAMITFAGAGALPNGYLLCDGSAKSSALYPQLYAVIGQLYGVGGGANDFNVPDMIDSFIMGNATTTGSKTGGSLTITNANIALTTIQSRNPTLAEGNAGPFIATAYFSSNGQPDFNTIKGKPSGDGSQNFYMPIASNTIGSGNLIDCFRTDIGQTTPTPVNPVPLSYRMVYLIKHSN
jgi:microcystin-dependent protein